VLKLEVAAEGFGSRHYYETAAENLRWVFSQSWAATAEPKAGGIFCKSFVMLLL